MGFQKIKFWSVYHKLPNSRVTFFALLVQLSLGPRCPSLCHRSARGFPVPSAFVFPSAVLADAVKKKNEPANKQKYTYACIYRVIHTCLLCISRCICATMYVYGVPIMLCFFLSGGEVGNFITPFWLGQVRQTFEFRMLSKTNIFSKTRIYILIMLSKTNIYIFILWSKTSIFITVIMLRMFLKWCQTSPFK